MPVANHEEYKAMIDHALKNKFAYPAINVSSISTANAAIEAFAEKKSDGIIQVSIGGGKFASGSLENPLLGSISLSDHVRNIAKEYGVFIALHTDHCLSKELESFVYPLIKETEKRRKAGLPNLFNSHMFDGSDLSLEENLKISKQVLELCHQNEIILEIEAGVVGGEEDGVKNEISEKLYTTKEDMLRVVEVLGDAKEKKYILAATFGNVHGVYKPGFVKLKPSILKEGQEAIFAKHALRLPLVFHGGSGSKLEEIHETLEYGVIKMNIDTDAQYAFSRPVVDHILKNYDGMLKIEGEMGNKKIYDPRAYLKKGRKSMKERIMLACDDLKSSGKTLFQKKQ